MVVAVAVVLRDAGQWMFQLAVVRGVQGGLRVEAGAVEPRESVMAPEKRIT